MSIATDAVARVTSTGQPSDSLRVRSAAQMSLELLPANEQLELRGSLDSLSVEPARVGPPGSGIRRLILPVPFGGRVGHNGRLRLRVGSDTASCWSEARAVLDPLGSLFPEVPPRLQRDTEWVDSTELSTCRLGVTLRVREIRRLRLEQLYGDSLAGIAYTSERTLAGEPVGRPVTVRGSGTARGQLRLHLRRGLVVLDSAEETLSLEIAAGGSAWRLEQRGQRRLSAAPAP